MPLLECGCWEGAWRPTTARPQCAAHGGQYGTAALKLADQLRGSAASTPRTIGVIMSQLIAAVHAEAGQAEASEEHAAFDAWQHVIQTLRVLRAQIDRAQKSVTVTDGP
jgi:hypothetical protein